MTQLVHQAALTRPDRRTHVRTDVGQRAVLRRDGQAPSPVTIVNVAREGCALGVEAELEPRQLVEIDMAGLGAVSGRIIWRSASAYGCRFDEALPAGAITQLLLAEDDGAVGANIMPGPLSRAKISPGLTLAVLTGMVICTWAGLAEVVLQFA